jgi:hypothetical protein
MISGVCDKCHTRRNISFCEFLIPREDKLTEHFRRMFLDENDKLIPSQKIIWPKYTQLSLVRCTFRGK